MEKTKSRSFASLRMTTVSLVLFVFLFSGCIRLTGTAGYWKKGVDDEAPSGKSVTLDTNDLVNHNQGNITS